MKRIRIVSPAKAIDHALLDHAAQWLISEGFEVIIGRYAAGQFNYFSGTDEERRADFQEALDDSETNIILCARGGYGCIRIVDQLDFRNFADHPKLIMGYSDVTVFHNLVHKRFNLPTAHTTAPLNFRENTEESLRSLLNVLRDKPNEYHVEGHPLNRQGSANAIVVGGNLSILSSLIGTDLDIETAGKILLIEEVGEAVYSIDRMMWSLKRSGKLEKLKGLVVGGITGVKDSAVPFGKSAEEVISEAVKDFEFPVCFNFPSGHIDDNRAVVLGKEASLNVNELRSTFRQ